VLLLVMIGALFWPTPDPTADDTDIAPPGRKPNGFQPEARL
jgi:hypothetical protein